MSYVITCGDEGVQINEGTRLGVVGAGLKLEEFPQIVKHLKAVLGKDLRIGASEENDWTKHKLDLSDWEQTNASAQQQVEALADKEKLMYIGIIPFADPKELGHGIKAHMVRPHNIHIATKITFTCGGGEQTYHLGQYVISADWVSKAPKKLVESAIKTQVEFYQSLGSGELAFDFQEEGELGEKVAQKNRKVIESLGYKAE